MKSEIKYCQQLEELPKNNRDIYRIGLYKCKITGEMCIAGTYYDPDPMSSLSSGSEACYYDDKARTTCPAYDVNDELANKIKLNQLEREKLELERKIQKETRRARLST